MNFNFTGSLSTYGSISVNHGLGPTETKTRHPSKGPHLVLQGRGLSFARSPLGTRAEFLGVGALRARAGRCDPEGPCSPEDEVPQRPVHLMAESTRGVLNREGNMRSAFQGNTSSLRDNLLIMDSRQLISQFRMQ